MVAKSKPSLVDVLYRFKTEMRRFDVDVTAIETTRRGVDNMMASTGGEHWDMISTMFRLPTGRSRDDWVGQIVGVDILRKTP